MATETVSRAEALKDVAHAQSHELTNVVALLMAAKDAVGKPFDVDGLCDGDSRTVALIHMAEMAVRKSIKAFNPYI